MAFEEIKAGLEKYCKELEEKRGHTGTEKYEETPPTEEEKIDYVIKLIRKQSPRPPQNIVYDEKYHRFVCRCYECGAAMYVDYSVNYCSVCGQAVLWEKVK